MSEPTNTIAHRWAQYKTEHATTLRIAKWSSLSLVVAAALLGVGAIAMRYGGHYQLNAAGFKQLGQDMGTLGPKMTSWWNSGRYSGGAMMATVIGTAAGGVALMVLPPKIKKWREERLEDSKAREMHSWADEFVEEAGGQDAIQRSLRKLPTNSYRECSQGETTLVTYKTHHKKIKTFTYRTAEGMQESAKEFFRHGCYTRVESENS